MKKMFCCLLICTSWICAFCAPVLAAEKKPSAQSEKMKNCNAEAKAQALKGDARKAFMSGCLKKKPPA